MYILIASLIHIRAGARKLSGRHPTAMRLGASNPQGWSWGATGGQHEGSPLP